MILARFWSLIFGYIRIVVTGSNLEKFINMAVSRGLQLWDIKHLGDNRMVARVSLAAFRPLRHVARRTGCRIKITGRKGLPFSWGRVRRRRMLLAGGVIFFVALYVLSSFVWSVEVKGCRRISARQIVKAAETAGLKQGQWKKRIEPRQVEEYIRDHVEGIAWVGVEIKGTRAIIEVVEKVLPPPQDNRPADLVAAKAGLVEKVLVLKGTPVVKEGDMVEKGQLLIRGAVVEETGEAGEKKNEEKGKKGKYRFLRAQGSVKARVWYEAYGEAQLVERKEEETGQSSEAWVLRIPGHRWTLRGPATPPYPRFRVREEVFRPGWRNLVLPVEVVHITYREVHPVTIRRTAREALAEATRRAWEYLQKQLPAQYEKKAQRQQEIRTVDENLRRVKIYIETVEEIAVPRVIKTGQPR